MNDHESRLRGLLRPWASAEIATTVDRDADLVEALRIDSLSALEFLAAVEKEFDVLLPDDKLHQLRSLHQVLAEVLEYQAELGDPGGQACESA